MNRLAKRDAMRAVKLADGTYLIRSGCCRPASCAPAADARCCFSAECVCDFPATLTAYTTRITQGPLPARSGTGHGRAGAIAFGVSVGVGAVSGVGWLIYETVAAAARFVAAHWGWLLFALVAVLVLGGPKTCTHIVKIVCRH